MADCQYLKDLLGVLADFVVVHAPSEALFYDAAKGVGENRGVTFWGPTLPRVEHRRPCCVSEAFSIIFNYLSLVSAVFENFGNIQRTILGGQCYMDGMAGAKLTFPVLTSILFYYHCGPLNTRLHFGNFGHTIFKIPPMRTTHFFFFVYYFCTLFDISRFDFNFHIVPKKQYIGIFLNIFTLAVVAGKSQAGSFDGLHAWLEQTPGR